MFRRSILLLTTCLILVTASRAETPSYSYYLDQVLVSENPSSTLPDFDASSSSIESLTSVDPQGKALWISSEVIIPQANLPLAIEIGAMASSELYWNGQPIASNGLPSSSRAKEIPGKMDTAFLLPPELVREGKNTFAARLSSHRNPLRVRQPIHYIRVVTPNLDKPLGMTHYLPALLTTGAFVLATLYFGYLAFSRRKYPYAIFIAAMAFFASVQLLAESARAIFSYPYPWQVWRLIIVTCAAAGFGISMTAYIAKRIHPARWRQIASLTLVGLIPAIYFLPGFDWKATACLLIPTLVSLSIVLPSALRKKTAEALIATALLSFATIILAEGAHVLDRSFYLAAAAMLLFVFIDHAREMKRIAASSEANRIRADQLELELLKRRIAPHFLMNTLNALIDWVESEPKVAVKLITALANEFRMLSQISDKAFIPLADEVDLCRYHLKIMSYRADRAYSLETQDLQPSLKVPPGILHTLVENAFTHGRYATGAVFHLKQSAIEERISLSLQCPAPIESKSDQGSKGDGSAYIRKQLSSAFGDNADFMHGPAKDGGWVATLSFNPDLS